METHEEVVRTFHDNGQVRTESTYVNGKLNGPCREFHPNGVMASEHWLTDNIYVNGTHKSWYESGQPSHEAHYLNGRQVGRVVFWNERGKIISCFYSLEDGTVTREQYLEACKTRPELPKCDELLKGERVKKARVRTNAVRVQPPMDVPFEATAWLGDANNRVGVMSNIMSKSFVDELYATGAPSVTVGDLHDAGDSGTLANRLIIALPKAGRVRRALFRIEAKHGAEEGFDPMPDSGQQTLELYF